MKRKWHHPAETGTPAKAWRGQDSLHGTAASREWIDREFAAGMPEDAASADLSRRNFVRLMGAATALAGLSGVSCRRPISHLVPFTKNVEWIIPGKPLFYTSAMPWADGVVPLVVTTHEGRPTKLDGNPLHPNSKGTSDSWAQAAILDLYDPDRSRDPLVRGQKMDAWDADSAITLLRQDMQADGGKGFAVLTGASPSPTRARLLAELATRHPGIRVYQYEPLAPATRHAAVARAFGPGVRALPRLEKSRRILSLDCDFLGVEKPTPNAAADFSAARRPEDDTHHVSEDMARLYVAEPAYTVTGGMADHRKRVPASQLFRMAVLIAREVAALTNDSTLSAAVSGINASASDHSSLDPRWIKECAADLVSQKGGSLVLVGDRQPLATHLVAFAINQALAAHGPQGCIDLVQGEPTETGDLTALAAAIRAGEVTTVLSLTPADPAYDAPGDLDWKELRSRLRKLVHLGPRVNRTAVEADLHIPGTHFLEEWSDALDQRGVYSIVQPMILPLYGGMGEITLLSRLLAEPSAESDADADPARDAVRATLEAIAQRTGTRGTLNDAWNQTLRDGFLAGTGYANLPAVAPALDALPAAAPAALVPPAADGKYEILFSADASVYDGRFINNGWLQEMPDPVTKLTWDNAALMSPATAKALGVDRFIGNGDQRAAMVEITIGEKSAKLPALVAYGHADGVITLPLGYGQCDGECDQVLPMKVGQGAGFDVNPLRSSASPFLARGTVAKADGLYLLALTQEHGSMEGRAIIREGTVDRYKDTPTFAATEGEDAHVPENLSFYKNVGFERPVQRFNTETGKFEKDPARFDRPHLFDERHQWAMVIDLSQCTGCNACLTACQSENNIPIVGKEQVAKGREMHWIRMDRYFVARQDKHGNYQDEDNPAMLMQPVACVQCEQAPCETVCPVNATVHSEDGLNLMAYNRCIGTRYCANNCPYKARRFNYFDYNKRPLNELYKGPFSSEKGVPQSLRLQKNPNVSVRMRGVMEKCTYCIQRLEEAKIKQYSVRRNKPQQTGVPSAETTVSVEELRIPTDSVKVACQQACPSEAIVFGNLLDEKSKVRKYKFIDMDKPLRPIRSLHPRNYDLLNYVGALPRTSYLARIKNPNPRMPDAAFIGNATISIH